jgi:hypothetical protein
VLTDVTTNMVITTEETFGPVAPLYRFTTRLRGHRDGQRHPHPNPPPRAGEGRRGLADYFYSRDIGHIWRVAEALEYGIVGINEGIISPSPLARSRRLAARRKASIRGRGRETRHRRIRRGNTLCTGSIDCWEPAAGAALMRLPVQLK